MVKEAKVRKKKKRRKKHYLLKFLLLVAVATGAYFLLTSSLFDIQKISVENNSYFTVEQVIKIAGAKTGDNLFEAPVGDMKDKLLADPYIKSVKIKRKLPAELRIILDERQEGAAVTYGKRFIIIDNEGMVLRKSATEPTLPLLLGMTVKKMDPGSPLEVEENSVLTDTLKLLSQVKKHDMIIKKVELSGVFIKAYITDQLIFEGTPENIANNLDSLQDVLYDLYTKGIERGVIKVGKNEEYIFFSPLVE